VFTVLPPHDRRAARIKENTVMGGPTALTADSAVTAVGPPITGSQLLHLTLLTNIRTSVKSREISRYRLWKWLRESIAGF